MSLIPVLLPQTALATKVPFNAQQYDEVLISASGTLGVGETITPYIGSSNGWQPIFNSAGTQIVIDSTHPQQVLQGGALYAFDKTASAAGAGIDANVRRIY